MQSSKESNSYRDSLRLDNRTEITRIVHKDGCMDRAEENIVTNIFHDARANKFHNGISMEVN